MKSETAVRFEELLRDARILADFSNLNAAEVDQSLDTHPEYFRRQYPDFNPQVWWSWQGLWEEEQRTLRDAWRAGFPLEQCVQLISTAAISNADEQAFEEAEKKAENKSSYIAASTNLSPFLKRLKVEPDSWIKPQVWPYQRAVMFLATVPWRARHCTVCLKRFVAGEPKQGVCSEKCRQEAERRRKRNWWSRSGKGWRSKKAKSRRKRPR